MDGTPHQSPLLQRPAGWLQSPQLAVVVSIQDELRLNRVQVRLIGCDDSDQQDAAPWARVVSPFAGKNRGAFLIPDVGDEVLVVFENGDPSRPLVLGGLWNGDSRSPADTQGSQNRYKVIRSRNGVKLTFDDQQGQERFIVETPGGQRITLKDGMSTVLIEDAIGNSIRMDAMGIAITAGSFVKVTATKVDVSAGVVQVDAALAKFSGIVQCQTLITNAVVSSSYTPGAGNIW